MADTAKQDTCNTEGQKPGVKDSEVKREPNLEPDGEHHPHMIEASAEKLEGKARPIVVKQEIQDEDVSQGQSFKAFAQHQNGNHPESVEQTESERTKGTSTHTKRKSETTSNDGPRKKPKTSKPVISKKPRQETLEAVKYISHVNDLILRGKGAKPAGDIDVKLPPISQAPKELQPHLRALQAAGLKLAKAVPAKIKAHVKVLGGVCHAFKGLQPWQNTRDGEPRVEDFKWQVQGMKHPLHSHQLLGSAIMITIEKSEGKGDQSQGSGLLLDFMGYGKTAQTIACVVSNPASSKKRKGPKASDKGTTLVVVPKSAATQWVEEVKKHTPRLMAILWTRQSESSRDHTLRADFLIVTYDQVRLMFKDSTQTSSLLFDTVFHRIVLDEAHKIKNRESVIFKACMSLKSTHKWCLSGTPIVNGAFELWPYLKFIGHPLVKDFPAFKRDYLGGRGGKNFKGQTEYEELNRLLLPISIMRTPGHQFCGVPLVSLPQEHAETHEVSLSDEERIILESLQNHIHDYILRKSGGQSNYLCLFEAFTRCRQYSSTPILLEGPVKGGLWTLDQLQSMRDEAHRSECAQTPFIDLFERWVSEPRSDHLAPTGDRKKDAAIAMANATVCTWCEKLPNDRDPVMAGGCIHLWCRECVEEWKEMCAKMEKELKCRKCKQPLGELRPVAHDQSPESEQDGNEKQRSRGNDYNDFQPADEGSTFLQKLDTHPEEPIPLGSKMKRILEQILGWQTDAPNDKIIGRELC